MKPIKDKIRLKTFVGLALIVLVVGFVGIIAIGFTSKETSTPATTEQTNQTNQATDQKYCNGQTTCYGKADLANHASADSCWGYIDNVMYDVTKLIENHTGGAGPIREVCGGDIGSFLDRAPQNKKHISANSNKAGSTLWAYKIGYYDPSKP